MAGRMANAEDPPKRPPTAVRTQKRFFFRTDPGYRQVTIKIPGHFEDPRYSDTTNAYLRRSYESKYPEEERAWHEEVRRANGGEWFIRFQHVPNRFEAFLATDSEVLARFIREANKPYIYEDAGRPQDVRVTVPSHRAQAALRLQAAAQTVAEAAQAAEDAA